MNVAQLKKLLAEAPDNALIVIPGSDHSYRLATPEVTTALHDGETGQHMTMTEDFGEEITPESQCGHRINVVLFA
jgi:hypothetical protein